ncbi:acyl-CoA carboxylase subunit epsilon [Streptomyces sp. NPDC059917]|uniref:acyl-CoA carboxylase subunit epsilon n=1 Tax=Streptomyces sp. NPDC059917 TaxID=3347002 RepID=UPI00365C4B33
MTADASELAQVSLRVLRGNPTLEETAALAVLFTARLRAAAGEPDTADGPGGCAATGWARRGAPFRSPGAWAS